MDDALRLRAIEQAERRRQHRPGPLRILVGDQLAELADLRAQAAAAGPVDLPAPEALADVLDGRLNACHERDLLLRLGNSDAEGLQPLAREPGFLGAGIGGGHVLQVDHRVGGAVQFE
jgi:hypothetical protein